MNYHLSEKDKISSQDLSKTLNHGIFEAVLQLTLLNEGGYVNDPDDPGGGNISWRGASDIHGTWKGGRSWMP